MKRQDKKDRMDESRGMKKAMKDRSGRGAFGVRDNEQAYEVRSVDAVDQDRGMGSVGDLPRSDRGYAPEAWRYDY